ncbi:Uncharacterised protein [Clostridium sporogenes]|nr:hypothetical protein [Clostridium sporogenes]SUY94524.1 Uncharacterised protein [Clostridium sporogenes]
MEQLTYSDLNNINGGGRKTDIATGVLKVAGGAATIATSGGIGVVPGASYS